MRQNPGIFLAKSLLPWHERSRRIPQHRSLFLALWLAGFLSPKALHRGHQQRYHTREQWGKHDSSCKPMSFPVTPPRNRSACLRSFLDTENLCESVFFQKDTRTRKAIGHAWVLSVFSLPPIPRQSKISEKTVFLFGTHGHFPAIGVRRKLLVETLLNASAGCGLRSAIPARGQHSGRLCRVCVAQVEFVE